MQLRNILIVATAVFVTAAFFLLFFYPHLKSKQQKQAAPTMQRILNWGQSLAAHCPYNAI